MDFAQLIILLETIASFGDFFTGSGAALSGSADILTGSGDILTGSGDMSTGTAALVDSIGKGFAQEIIAGSVAAGS